jgi:protein-S-isoprenylcysteine O-methyltransferase Ste14
MQAIYYPYTLFGILLITFGAVIDIMAWKLFVKNKTTQNPFKYPSKLITIGVYRASRNPMYLGMLVFLLGLAVLMGSLIAFIFPVIFFIIMEKKFIPLEEKNMEKQFGKKYRKYKSEVRRWI